MVFIADLGNTIDIYVDGILWHTADETPDFNGYYAPYSADASPDDAAFRIGGADVETGTFDVDLVAVFDYPLTQTEVEDIGGLPSSIREFMSQNQIARVYPNPATDFVNLKVGTPATYQVINMVGQEIDRGTVNSKVTIDVSGYEKGMYFVRVNNTKGQTITRKVMVQ